DPLPYTTRCRSGIDNDAGRIHPPGLQQRHDGQQRSRGIASGIAHDPGLADAAAMEFSQPVDSFIQQARARVRGMIPLLIHLGVFESEEDTSELQSPDHLVCRLLLEKKNTRKKTSATEPTDTR